MLPYAHEMFRMLNAAFANTYSCVSINDRQIEVYTNQYFSFSRSDYPKLVLDKQGEAVGFVSAEINIELGGNLKVQNHWKYYLVQQPKRWAICYSRESGNPWMTFHSPGFLYLQG